MTTTTETHLTAITNRHSHRGLRDALFAACIALAAAVSITTVSTASHVASTSQVVQR
jgi:hypothetical protein